MDRDDIFQDDPSNRSPLALDQGTLLNDQFRVGRVLGMGGFGVTYLAFDEVLEMAVAVKEYLPNDIAVRETNGDTIKPLSSSSGGQDFEYGLERFLQEARTLAKFERHSNIVRVRTFFEENGTAYLVMNFYEGRTLAEYLEARNGFIPEEEALLIMEQVVDGLMAVHEEEILHRDIDPNNVYLADDGTVVLLDFGAARTAVGERTHSMSVVLKRGYAPHEQYHSYGDQGPWTDVYASAATLYRALTGYKPPEAAARILEDDLAMPNELVPSLSEATNEAVVKGLEVRPEDRPQSMEAFAELLPPSPDDVEPGWIGEPTSLERNANPGGTAELQVTATHACRLYVDGQQAATLPAEERFTVGVEEGTHRLRAVRTDQSRSGEATVTASGTSIEEGRHEARMSLDALVWQDVVSASVEEPTTVEIDFQSDGAGGAVSGGGGATESMQGDTGQGDTIPGNDLETEVEPVAGEAPPPSQKSTEEAEASATSSENPPNEGQETVVRMDRAARLFVDGAQEAVLDPGDEHVLDRTPGTYQVRAEAVDGTEQWEQDVVVDDGTSRTLEVTLDRTVEHDRGGLAFDGTLRSVAIGAGGLFVLLLVGWWSFFSNERPRPRPDRLLTTANTATLNVLANDRDPDGTDLRIQSVESLPDSVGRVTAIDSARLRFRPASTFAGTVRVRYTLADAVGDTAHSYVSLQVPYNGEQRVITDELDQPQVVHADSLGGDGDLDVVMAALGNRAVSWSQNALADDDGFQQPKVLDSAIEGAVDVHTADLNGDGRIDVLSASLRNDVVAWYENQGGGEFSRPRRLATIDGAVSVRAADFDQDGDADVVSGALLDQTVRWYENREDSTFSEGRLIADDVPGLETLHVTDLDNDRVPDVLVVSYQDSTIARYEPVPTADSVRFVERPPIGTDLREPIEVHTADVTGNGRKDVIAGKAGGEAIVLFENRADTTEAELTFGEGRVLVSDLRTVEGIDTGDLDGDGALDIFAASFDSDKVVWFRNQGNGTFGSPQPISTTISDVLSLEVSDVDRDGDLDVLIASQAENVVSWFENYLR